MTTDEHIRSYADRLRRGQRPGIGKGMVDMVWEARARPEIAEDCQLIINEYPRDFQFMTGYGK